jgi:hypothetical protein
MGAAALEALVTPIATICSVSGRGTNPAASFVKGVPEQVVAGEGVRFTVTAVDFAGEQRTEGGDVVAVTFQHAGRGGGGRVVEVEDGADGTYSGTFVAPPEGGGGAGVGGGGAGGGGGGGAAGGGGGGVRWQLGILVQGVPIAGSPFAVEVSAAKKQQQQPKTEEGGGGGAKPMQPAGTGGKKNCVFERITQGGHRKTTAFDGKGVLHWIGTNGGTAPYVNPHTMEGGGGVVAAMSSVGGLGSTPARFVMHDHDGSTLNYTSNKPNSWMSVDLGAGRLLAATHYVLRHGWHNGNARLVQWRFEGSNDGASWTLLKAHTHSTSPFPAHAYSVAAWPVDPPPAPPSAAAAAAAAAAGGGAAGAGAAGSQGFRHFRIIQTGENCFGNNYLFCAGIELYGVLTDTT